MKRFKSTLAVIIAVVLIICSLPISAFAFSTSDYFRVFEGATWNADNLKSGSTGAKISVVPNDRITHDGEYVKLNTAVANDANKTWDSYVLFDNSIMGAKTDIKAYAMFIDFSESASWSSGNLDVAFKLVDKNGKDLGLYKDNKSTAITATLVSTVTGKKETAKYQTTGGIRLPKGFVGWVVIPMDNAKSSLNYSTVGGISLKRVNTDTVSAFASTTVYFDDVYAIRDVNKFVGAAQNAGLGMMTGSNAIDISTDMSATSKREWTVKWNAVAGAVKYVANAYDCYGIHTFGRVETTSTSAKFYDLFMFDSKDTVQVIAYNSAGNIIAVSRPQEFNTSKPYEWVGNPMVAGDASQVAGNNFVDGVIRPNISSYNADASNLLTKDSINTPDGSQVKAFNLSNTISGTQAAPSEAATFGYAIDIAKPTLVAATGIAVWADFSDFEYDDYWKPYIVNDTVVKSSQFDAATWNSPQNGHNTALTTIRQAWGTAVTKKGKATLINTVTGEVTTNSYVSGGSETMGGFRVPAGFVGYIYFEFDNTTKETSSFDKFGAFGIYRHPKTVSTTSTDTSVANMNCATKNTNSFWYLGDIYIVNELDAFIKNVYAGSFGKLVGDQEFKIEVVDGAATTTVKFEQLKNAAKYVVNIYDSTNKYKVLESKEATGGICTFETNYGTTAYAQVIAYDAKGNIIDITSPAYEDGATCNHNYIKTVVSEANCLENGENKFTCSFCGSSYNETVAALGHDWVVDEDVEETCTVDGVLRRHCARCNTSDVVVRPAGHALELKTVPATVSENGYSIMACTRPGCGYEDESTRTVIPAVGRIGEINNMNSVSTINRGPEGAIQFFSFGSNITIGNPKYGPSLKYASLQIRSWGGAVAKLNFNSYTQGFAFYIDTTGTLNYSVASRKHLNKYNYYDISLMSELSNYSALANQPIENGTSSSNSEYIIGREGMYEDLFDYTNYGVKARTYNTETGVLSDVLPWVDEDNNGKPTGEIDVGVGFKGYVIIDLTGYNGPRDLSEIVEVGIVKTSGVNPTDATTNAQFTNGLNRVAIDNLMSFNDMDDVIANPEEYFVANGTLFPSADDNTVTVGDIVAASDPTKGTQTYTAVANANATKYIANVYEVAEDGDTLKLIASGESLSNVIAVDVPLGKSVYVQTVAVAADRIYASVVKKHTVASAVPTNLSLSNVEDDYTVTEVAGGVKITGYIGEYTAVINVPATIGGKKVVAIGDRAFFNGVENRTVSVIRLPKTVTSIGSQAFRGMKTLVSVSAPGVRNIASDAFMGCTALNIN